MKTGAPVEVFSRFERSWVRGFVLVREERDPEGTVTWRWVRRISDRTDLPQPFPRAEVRASVVAASIA